MDLAREVKRELEGVELRLQSEVFLNDCYFEGNGFGHSINGTFKVITPQRGINGDGLVVNGNEEEANDVGTAGIEEVKGELEVVGRGVPIGQPATLH